MMFKAFLRMLIFRRQLPDSEMANGNMVCSSLATHYKLFDHVVKQQKAEHINYSFVSDVAQSDLYSKTHYHSDTLYFTCLNL